MPPIRADRNRNEGGILIFINEGVPVKEVTLLSSTEKEIEAKAIEINLQKIYMATCWYLPSPFPRRFFSRRNT